MVSLYIESSARILLGSRGYWKCVDFSGGHSRIFNLTCNGVSQSCNANGVVVDLQTKYIFMELNNGKSIG